jgi:hypothetical protein
MSVWERKWKMNFATHGLHGAEFALQKHKVDGIVYYTMKVDQSGSDKIEAWENCRLIERGIHSLTWSPLAELHPFNDGREDYNSQIDEWLKRVTAATLRLEGEIDLVADPQETTEPQQVARITPLAVTMFVAKKAVQTDDEPHDLLMVRLRSTGNGLSIVGGPDGTGHGDPT